MQRLLIGFYMFMFILSAQAFSTPHPLPEMDPEGYPAPKKGCLASGKCHAGVEPIRSHDSGMAQQIYAMGNALGYGTHDGRYLTAYTKGVYVDVATATGEIISKNAQLQISPIPELPMDLDQVVTRDDKQLQTVGHHWPMSGPLPKEMRDRMEKVGVCISCHKDFKPGFFMNVHKKNFHSDIMEDMMKPGSFFHQLFDFREEHKTIEVEPR